MQDEEKSKRVRSGIGIIPTFSMKFLSVVLAVDGIHGGDDADSGVECGYNPSLCDAHALLFHHLVE